MTFGDNMGMGATYPGCGGTMGPDLALGSSLGLDVTVGTFALGTGVMRAGESKMSYPESRLQRPVSGCIKFNVDAPWHICICYNQLRT